MEALSQNTHFLSVLKWVKFLIFFPAQLGGMFPTNFSPKGGTGNNFFPNRIREWAENPVNPP